MQSFVPIYNNRICAYIVCLSDCPPHLMQVLCVGEKQQGCVRHVARQKKLKGQTDTYKNWKTQSPASSDHWLADFEFM